MGGRLETFPYEALLIWQQFHGSLTEEQAARFIDDPNVKRIGAFGYSTVRAALQETPNLSEATIIARATGTSMKRRLPTSGPTGQPERGNLAPDEQRVSEPRTSVTRPWRTGGYGVRRAEIWAAQNRHNPTDAEKKLEAILRTIFWRTGALQVQWIFGKPSEPYILDFFIPAVRLGIEVDGSIHDDPLVKARDEDKEEMAKSIGITVRRFTNSEVFSSKRQALLETVKFWYIQADQFQRSERLRPR